MPDDQPLAPPSDDEHRDELPADLDVSGWVGPYTFPNITRRRWPAAVYAVTGLICIAVWVARGDGGVLVNGGFLAVGVGLLAIAAYHVAAAFDLKTKDVDALAAAGREVGFPIGHASAQLGWRGLRSRPTWRILLYSAEEPPTTRGLVLVDGVDGRIVDHFVEENPEDWTTFSARERRAPADS